MLSCLQTLHSCLSHSHDSKVSWPFEPYHTLTDARTHTPHALFSPTVSAVYVYTGTSFREISSSWMGSLAVWTKLSSVSQATQTSSGSLSVYRLKIFVVTSLLRNAQRTYLIIMHLIWLFFHMHTYWISLTSVFVAISNVSCILVPFIVKKKAIHWWYVSSSNFSWLKGRALE